MAKRSIYLSAPVRAAIDMPDEGEGPSLSGRVGFLCTAAARIAAEASPALPLPVWLQLVEANNGTMHDFGMGERAVLDGMLHNLADSAPNHHPDPAAAARELAALSFTQRFAVFEIVRAAWTSRGKAATVDAPDWSVALRRLGARVKG